MDSDSKVSELNPHQHYKELCALAAAGQLSDSDGIELNEHLKHCEDCRELVRGFTFLCVQILPAATALEPLPPGMTGRFIARARSEGITISDVAKKAIASKHEEVDERNAWKTAFWVAVAASFLIGGILLWIVRGGRELSSAEVVANHATPSVGPGSSEGSPSGSQRIARPGVGAEVQALEAQLRSTEARLVILSEELKRREREVERLQKAPGNTASSTAVEAELKTLRATVERQKHQLNELLSLIPEEPSTGGLLAKRNSHVINVFPIDESGKPANTFAGRVLYLEGNRLEFYAFDLNHYKGTDESSIFYLWGQTRDTDRGKGRVVLLGKFILDTSKDNCWWVVVSDPVILAGLGQVFITVETSDNPATPTGKKLLRTPLPVEPHVEPR